MFCSQCGTQLPDDANFCLKCGQPTGQAPAGVGPEKWEHCQIERKCSAGFLGLRAWTMCWFWADAVGPAGRFSAGESRKYSDLTGEEGMQAIHNELVQQLIHGGWEPTTERGEDRFQRRFRRPAKWTH